MLILFEWNVLNTLFYIQSSYFEIHGKYWQTIACNDYGLFISIH